MPWFQYKFEAYKETRKYGQFTGKKKLRETFPSKGQTLDLLNKGNKSTVLNMFKKLKEIIENGLKKTRRMMSQQKENISKKI